MSELTEFLLARIADDERWAQMAGHGFGHQPLRAPRSAGWTDIDESENVRPSYDAGFIARHDPARVLRECEAKRRIVRMVESGSAQPGAARYLAAVYADHPDYREQWKP